MPLPEDHPRGYFGSGLSRLPLYQKFSAKYLRKLPGYAISGGRLTADGADGEAR